MRVGSRKGTGVGTDEGKWGGMGQGDVDFKTAPWPSISPAAKDIVMKLLNPDPAKRPTAQGILEVLLV